ncbi:MAG: DUF4367 domain-containing protein [Oscillospiraceae bacterium]|nr:DUF4367 domain-containing protein [Oscillospiraceae bacterium]
MDNRKPSTQEARERAFLSQMMDAYAETLGKTTLEEYEAAKDPAVPDTADALCREILRSSGNARPSAMRRAWKAAIIAAAIAAALFLALLGVQAAGIDAFGALASWTGEIFKFVSAETAQYDPQGHTYEFVYGMYSWEEAQKYAKEAGGYLARFDSEEEFQYVTAELSEQNQDTVFLIGAKRAENSRDYFFIDGEDAPVGGMLNSPDSWACDYWADGEPTYEWDGEQEWIVTVEYDAARGGWILNDVVDNLAYPPDPNSHGIIIEFEPQPAQETQSEMQSVLTGLGLPADLAPTQIPTGYALSAIERINTELCCGMVAVYENGGSFLNIEISRYADANALNNLALQMDDVVPEKYMSNGKLFYLFTNTGNWRAAWNAGSYVVSIGGLLAKEQLIEIIDSIPAD